MRSSYFIQSAHTIYLCMGMAIYLSYLLLEVVMLIRITILNRFNENFQSPQKRLENCSSTGSCTGWTGLASNGERRGGVQAHVLVLQRDLEQREDDQDEDEVD